MEGTANTPLLHPSTLDRDRTVSRAFLTRNRTTNQNIVAMVAFTAETLVQIEPIKASLSHGRK